MIELSLQQVTEVTHGTLTIDSASGSVMRGVSIDSRTLRSGELYIAIRGDNHDGHLFVESAQTAGAIAALVGRSAVQSLPVSFPAVVVEDTHQALIELAVAHRKKITDKTAGVTGSAGKTAVKEMTRHLLESAGTSVHASAGNLNNLFGLPLSVLRMDKEAQYGIFEMGISTQGEMKRLAPILRPFVGAITNASESHLESLGSLAGVRREKLALLEYLQPSGIAVVNGVDAELVAGARVICENVLTFGASNTGDTKQVPYDTVARAITLDSATGYVSFEFEGQRVELPAYGKEQVNNALCAITVCRALGADVEMRFLESFASEAMTQRGQRKRIAGVDVILDCYNANPSSMRAGLQTFVALKPQTPGRKKIVLIGDMLELGAVETQEHLALGKLLSEIVTTKSGVDIIITVGERARLVAEGFQKSVSDSSKGEVTVHSVDNAQDAGDLLAEIAVQGDLVYLKASRGIALERALLALKARSQV